MLSRASRTIPRKSLPLRIFALSLLAILIQLEAHGRLYFLIGLFYIYMYLRSPYKTGRYKKPKFVLTSTLVHKLRGNTQQARRGNSGTRATPLPFKPFDDPKPPLVRLEADVSALSVIQVGKHSSTPGPAYTETNFVGSLRAAGLRILSQGAWKLGSHARLSNEMC